MEIADLGLTQEQLAERVVDSITRRLLERKDICMDEDGEEFINIKDTPFKAEIQVHIKNKIDEVIKALVNKHIMPKAENMIANLTFQETNRYGEPKKEPQTFLEYLTDRANHYMTEEVNYEGKTYAQDSYSWKKKGTRIEYMIDQYLQYSLETWAKDILAQANNQLTDGLKKAVEMKLEEITGKLKFEVKMPR